MQKSTVFPADPVSLFCPTSGNALRRSGRAVQNVGPFGPSTYELKEGE